MLSALERGQRDGGHHVGRQDQRAVVAGVRVGAEDGGVGAVRLTEERVCGASAVMRVVTTSANIWMSSKREEEEA